MDDLLVSASSMRRLRNRIEYVLKVCESSNAKLSPSKFDISTCVTFGGHKISSCSKTNNILIQPCSEKLEAIKNLSEPRTKTEVQSLVGFISQMASFVPEVKSICPVIKRQTSKFSTFQWGPEESREFSEIKKRLNQVIPITPIDTSKPLVLHCDASQDGIGWILPQMSNPDDLANCYKSQQTVLDMGSASLTPTQRRYSPIEMEMLAVVTAIKKLDYFC